MYPVIVQPSLSQTPLVDTDSRSGSVTPVNSPTPELNLQLVQSVLTDIHGQSFTPSFHSDSGPVIGNNSPIG